MSNPIHLATAKDLLHDSNSRRRDHAMIIHCTGKLVLTLTHAGAK